MIKHLICSQAKFFLFALLFAVSMGCEGLLEVKNPNNILEENLNDPSAAAGIANGAVSTVANGIGYIFAPYEVATDEVYWIGSRDAWNQLDKGTVSDAYNEFVDQAWPPLTEGRWMADKAISLLEGFDAAGTLKNRLDLAKSYLHAALVRVVIADMFDNFVFSDKVKLGTPFGESNMASLYDQATALLDKALSVAQSGTSASHKEMQSRVLSLRARAKHAKEAWALVNPGTIAPRPNPYVGATARADAQAALALISGDWKWQLIYFGTANLFNEIAWEIVGRSEMTIEPTPTDPMTGAADTRIAAIRADFLDRSKYQDRYSPLTMTSAREMHLIVAESYLAANDTVNARTSVNACRALANAAAAGNQHDIRTIFRHERRANLFLQGRRLSDMYRWGIRDARWLSTSDTYSKPGSFFPITIQEIRSNPNVR